MKTHIDSAGQLKLATLDEALSQLQRVHGIVERMAIAARAQTDTGQFRQQLQRAAKPLVGLLKLQFASISDQVASMILVTTRGGGDQARVRALRECVGQIRAQIEATITRVREIHSVHDDATNPPPS